MNIRVIFAALAASVGFLTGVGVSLTIFVSTYSSKGFIGWLYGWQTLIGGFFAVFAAVASVAAIVWQSRESTRGVEAQLDAAERAKQDMLARKRIATLALMPAVLDEISEYIARCASLIRQAYTSRKKGAALPRIEEPSLPRHVMEDLKELIENLAADEAHVVADLLSAYQVHSARMKNFILKNNNPASHVPISDIEHLYIKCTEIKLRCDSMFTFARREAEHLTPPNFEKTVVTGALHLLGISDAMSDGFRARLVGMLSQPPLLDHPTA